MFTVKIPTIAYPENTKHSDIMEWFDAREKFETNVKKNIKNELLTNSHIRNISLSAQTSILNDEYQMVGELDWDGKNPNFQPQYATWGIDDNFYEIMNLELEKGAWFQKGDDRDVNQVILNETAVRDFGIPAPVIGRRFNNNGTEGTVIGIVKDFHFQDFHQKIAPMVISKKSYWGNNLIIQTQPTATREALMAVETLFRDRFPGKSFSYKFMDEAFDQLYRKDRQTLMVALSFSILCIVLSFLGLLGMVFFDVKQRTKEIGIRKVLGASVINIAKLFSTDFVKIVLIAILIASPIAWWTMNRWLEDFAYRIEVQWWMFALAGTLVMIITVVTVSFQAIKAAVVNPVDSLRTE